jgi:alpha-tubulin suppressor-like RCC1 family protein
MISRTSPVDVLGLSSGVLAVTAGATHTCALTGDGGIKCWGANDNGQLGDGTTTHRTTPVDVLGLASGVQAVSAGYWHTCALTADNAPLCWGNNSNGELGDGTTTQRTTPVGVVGLAGGVSAVVGGGGHTCALTEDNAALCWGWNTYGQLGDGTRVDRLIPVGVSGLGSDTRAIAAGGGHSCALDNTGGGSCWGNNGQGQLGDGTTTQRVTPVDVWSLGGGIPATATPSATATPTCTPTVTPTTTPVRRYLPLILHQ